MAEGMFHGLIQRVDEWSKKKQEKADQILVGGLRHQLSQVVERANEWGRKKQVEADKILGGK